MFGKLVKHEFHATARIALPLCGMMLALAVLAGMVLRFWGDLPSGGFSTAGNAIIILYGMSVFAVAIGIFIILMQRYKQNFFGDEGYLTRTLPASEHALLLSKLLVAVLWYLATCAMMALSVIIAGALSGEASWSGVRELLGELSFLLRSISAADVAHVTLSTLGSMLLVTLLFYAVATIAQNFNKHRLLYYFMVILIFIALVRLLAVFNLIFTARVMEPMGGVGIIGGADGPTAIYVTGSHAWMGFVELYLGNVLLYFLTWAFLKYRPNLE